LYFVADSGDLRLPMPRKKADRRECAAAQKLVATEVGRAARRVGVCDSKSFEFGSVTSRGLKIACVISE
jgi:hypothetical protein